MTFSLNEVESLGKRATRGAGFDWGLAEDAGKAARWLCGSGIDGVAAMAAFLSAGRLGPPVYADPSEPWTASSGLCALCAGSHVSDCAGMLAKAPTEMIRVGTPILLLPFAANIARRLGVCITLTCDEITAVTDGTLLDLHQPLPQIATKVVLKSGGVLNRPLPRVSRADPSAQDWDILNAFANRTYAPSTEASRRLGAGSDLSDND